jgi:hypothetical protein
MGLSKIEWKADVRWKSKSNDIKVITALEVVHIALHVSTKSSRSTVLKIQDTTGLSSKRMWLPKGVYKNTLEIWK